MGIGKPGLFVNYRHEDAKAEAKRLADDLQRFFPEHEIFRDFSSLHTGDDFPREIDDALAKCAATLVVMGRNWAKPGFLKRLHDPKDWVRREIVRSMNRASVRVLPILVAGAKPLKTEHLPKSLKKLARLQARSISDEAWESDVRALIDDLNWVFERAEDIFKLECLEESSWISQERALASLKPRTIFRHGPRMPEMIVLPAGTFDMGSPTSEPGREPSEGPQHKVKIESSFAIGRFAVTFDEWDYFVEMTGGQSKPHDRGWGRGNRPVINVSWDDANRYVAWISDQSGADYRLPSEAEWEYAARAGTKSSYPWGDNEPGDKRANCLSSGSEYSGKRTAPVDAFEPNQFGLFGVIGNVNEWVEDEWHSDYNDAPTTSAARAREDLGAIESRVLRGGSWLQPAKMVRVAARQHRHPADGFKDVGFRVVCDLASDGE